MEHKSVSLEIKDFSPGSRTAVVAHAVYNNIDRTGDISRKGMFTKSWQENPKIDFLFNHDPKQVPGYATKMWEDDNAAYTELKFGNWTLGNDVMEMADAGVIKGVSFGYVTNKKNWITVKGKKVRELKEVFHAETSLLTVLPANPLASVVSLTKSLGIEYKKLSDSEQAMLKKILLNDQSALEQLISISGSIDSSSDLYTWINWNISRRADMMGEIRSQIKWSQQDLASLKSYVSSAQKFIRNSKASDDCMKAIENEIDEVKTVLSIFDTADTTDSVANDQEQSASEKKDSTSEVLVQLQLLTSLIN